MNKYGEEFAQDKGQRIAQKAGALIAEYRTKTKQTQVARRSNVPRPSCYSRDYEKEMASMNSCKSSPITDVDHEADKMIDKAMRAGGFYQSTK